jgi:hypothetical protein
LKGHLEVDGKEPLVELEGSDRISASSSRGRLVKAVSNKPGRTYGAVVMLIQSSTKTLTMTVLIAALDGCTPGPYFQMVDPIPDNMAIVYMYRPTQDFGDWLWQSVYVNDRKVATLSSPGYTSYLTPPGFVNVKIVGLREAYMRFEVEAGKSYFVKSSTNKISSESTATGIDVLAFMDTETSMHEIRNCQLQSDISADQRGAH